MTADLIRFVDSIVAVPTVRLDVNDQGATGTTWHTRLDPGTPRLRRAMSSNAMRDGVSVSSSTYDARVLRFSATLRAASQDALATGLQQLQRELDRETNILMYQPFGATKPVFFETYRSDMSQIRQVPSQVAMQELEFEVLAAPFALGLRQTIVVGTVNNDPAAASNGCFFDVTGVIGDVATPCIITGEMGTTDGWLGTRVRGTPSNVNTTVFLQAENASGGSAVNPGGAADPIMSGTALTNYRRLTPPSSAQQQAIVWTLSGTDAERIARGGTYRARAIIRLNGLATSPYFLQVRTAYTTSPGASVIGKEVPITVDSGRQFVDLGLVHFQPPQRNPLIPFGAPLSDIQVDIYSRRASGTDTLDFDYLELTPADEWSLAWDYDDLSLDTVIDGYQEVVYGSEAAGDIFAGTANVARGGRMVGACPDLTPNRTNRIFMSLTDGYAIAKGTGSTNVAADYWPRYVFVRPSAT